MPIERWRNSETGEWYEVEFADPGEALGPKPKASQLPGPAPDPIAPSGAVLAPRGAAQPHSPPDPRRVRLVARLLRQILEKTDD